MPSKGTPASQDPCLKCSDMSAAAQSFHAFVEMADPWQNDLGRTGNVVSDLGDADIGRKTLQRIHHRLDIG